MFFSGEQLKKIELTVFDDYSKCVEVGRQFDQINLKIKSDLDYIIHMCQSNSNKMKNYKQYVINNIESEYYQKELDSIEKSITKTKKTIDKKRSRMIELNNIKTESVFELKKFMEIKEYGTDTYYQL